MEGKKSFAERRKDVSHLFDRLTPEGHLETIDMYTGEVVSSTANVCSKRDYSYTVDWGDAICEAVRTGMTMKQINDDPRLPPVGIIYKWRDLHPDFKERLIAAKKDRGEYYRDRVIETAEDIEDKEGATIARVKMEAYKWAAEKDDPARYGANIKVDTKHSGQVGFFALRTGVPRSEEEKELTPGADGLSIEASTTETEDER